MNRGTETETDRQTQTDRHTDRQTDKERNTDRNTDTAAPKVASIFLAMASEKKYLVSKNFN